MRRACAFDRLCADRAGGIFALLLRDNFEPSFARLLALAPYLLLTVVAAAMVFPVLGISRTIWRFGNEGLPRLLAAIVLTVVAAVAFAFGYNPRRGCGARSAVLQALLMIIFQWALAS